MKVFLDTNVLVSAFATRGLCADLFEIVLLEHDLVLGRQVLLELDRALRSKLKLTPARSNAIVRFVSGEAVQVVAQAPAARVRADPADARVLGEAILAGAAAFVTGDAALLALHSIEGMEILSPRGFWEKIRTT